VAVEAAGALTHAWWGSGCPSERLVGCAQCSGAPDGLRPPGGWDTSGAGSGSGAGAGGGGIDDQTHAASAANPSLLAPEHAAALSQRGSGSGAPSHPARPTSPGRRPGTAGGNGAAGPGYISREALRSLSSTLQPDDAIGERQWRGGRPPSAALRGDAELEGVSTSTIPGASALPKLDRG
jgi:hypothetical protein